jgi:hypothetical protein
MLPNPGRYGACLHEAYDELADALGLRSDHRHHAPVEWHARRSAVPMRGSGVPRRAAHDDRVGAAKRGTPM